MPQILDIGITNDQLPGIMSTMGALTDPNADRILFWDDSASAFKFLTAGTGLSISGTTLTATATATTINVDTIHGTSSTDTTTSTSMVDMTDMSINRTPAATAQALAMLYSSVKNSGAGLVVLDIRLDSAADVDGNYNAGTAELGLSVQKGFTGITAASHNIKGRWRVTSGTGTINGNSRELTVVWFA